MRMMNLVSGSSGNSTLVGTDRVNVLCDVGVSLKRIEENLNSAGLSGKDIDAILITHEHIDHVSGLGVFMRKYNVPVYATDGTIFALGRMKSLGRVDHELFRPFRPGDGIQLKDLEIRSHKIFHDAAEPVCFSFSSGNSKCCIATDLGTTTAELISELQGCDAMLIEANHDVRMLQVGPYPYQLKQRILGDFGHLSNESGGAFIRALLNEHVKEIRLGHLSKENNYPELALLTVKQELLGNPYSPDPEDLPIYVAGRESADPMIEF